MPWFKVDDNLAFHAKVVAAGNAAMGLWVRAGSWSADQLTDGFIPDHMIASLGKPSEARSLVAVRLWHKVDGGYTFHQWAEDGRQPAKEDVLKHRQAERDRKAEWRRRKAEGRTPLSQRDGQRDTSRTDGGTDAVVPPGVPLYPTRPDPYQVQSTSVVEVVPHLNGSGDVRDDLVDLETIARATRGDHTHARRVARDVLSKARTKPSDPTTFVLTAVRADPARHRANAPPTSVRCGEHAMDLPCQACASERKAAR